MLKNFKLLTGYNLVIDIDDDYEKYLTYLYENNKNFKHISKETFENSLLTNFRSIIDDLVNEFVNPKFELLCKEKNLKLSNIRTSLLNSKKNFNMNSSKDKLRYEEKQVRLYLNRKDVILKNFESEYDFNVYVIKVCKPFIPNVIHYNHIIDDICFEHLPIEDNKGNVMFADSYGFIHHYSDYKLCDNDETSLLKVILLALVYACIYTEINCQLISTLCYCIRIMFRINKWIYNSIIDPLFKSIGNNLQRIYQLLTKKKSTEEENNERYSKNNLGIPITEEIVNYRANNHLLYDISLKLSANGYNLSNTDLPLKNINYDIIIDNEGKNNEDDLKLLQLYISNAKKEQINAFNFFKLILNADREYKVMMIEGPAGTGKTYVYQMISTYLRTEGKKYVNLASTGIAASLLPEGQTVHSFLKMPLNINKKDYVVDKKSIRTMTESDIFRLKNASAIFIDEVSMLSKKQLQYIDMALQKNTKNYNCPFGGKVIVLGGDFRQCLPISDSSTTAEIIASTILSSKYFTSENQVKRIFLTENMRVGHGESDFAQFLLQIGNGETYNSSVSYTLDGRMDNHRFITIPKEMIFDNDDNQFIEYVFGKTKYDISKNKNSAILASTNNVVNNINEKILNKYFHKNMQKTYLSNDNLYFQDDFQKNANELEIDSDDLNTFNPSGYPLHELKVAKGCVLICLRNLDIKEGLCNGTRIIYNETIETADGTQKLLKCMSLDGKKTFLIPKIIHTPVDLKIPIPFTRYQYPVKLGFCITINKSQGQTLENVGLYLEESLFAHGQLYVALSRVRSASKVKVKWAYEQSPNRKGKIKNVIIKNLIQLATNPIQQISTS
ncbi:DNA helicase Pif1 like family and P-loop containing nucleoside triphosphate hydrolase domain-containing protein [Strongyloides ratti]|uniref:ATP-dependent DNA helicase n=1 Tax=Strongyloides ratti TaxID=34506 RepID=A0A090L2F3_STRRB|nr:DNA helicase Pif1 like family and P-loop containing nucleoside triphosphate hydrolase domain-containing protein [Strongyloides ratti]CEF61639.1 DNA helicase Pif1 like family and P-loop containing nucleoside triphosphate hydrolase domain-containing protein [Strongyloides ratti]